MSLLDSIADELTAASTGADTGLTMLVLPVSIDNGETWHRVDFVAENAAAVDQQAATYVMTYRDRLQINISDDTDWSQFPVTFNELTVGALEVPVFDVESLHV